MGRGSRAPVERLVDLAVGIPLSVAAAARQLLPFGMTRLERRVARDLVTLQRYARMGGAAGAPAGDVPAAADPALQEAPAAVVAEAAAADTAGDDALPLEGYDQLSARQIVDRLPALTADELAAVEAYERTHRRRQTVLARIAQLT